MKRTKILGMALVAAFAMSAVASATASALNNPQWQICEKTGGPLNSECTAGSSGQFEGVLLTTGSKEVTATQVGVQKLSNPTSGLVIVCQTLKLKAGATIIGHAAPAAGTSAETIEYGECEVEGFPNCLINGKKSASLTTLPLTDTLVFQTKAAAEGQTSPTLTLFEPTTPKLFIEFTLSGTCPVTGAVKVEGAVLVENVNGQNYATSHTLNAPATSITKYFVNNGATTEEKTAKLTVLGTAAKYVGESKVQLASGLFWRVFN